MAYKSLRILCQIDFPTRILRLWDGAGPCMGIDGEVWLGAVLTDGLDQIESALNGEAAELTLGLSAIDPNIAALAFEDLEAGRVIGSKVRILLQPCDEWDQPASQPKVKFTGTIADMEIGESVNADQIVSTISVLCVNRFDLRTLVSGSVLSDVDQRARSAVLNPEAPGDRFAERVPRLNNQTIRWPFYG